MASRKPRLPQTAKVTATVKPSNASAGIGVLSFSDVSEAGIIRTMDIVLANGKEGKLYYRAMSVKESREFRKDYAKKTEQLKKTVVETEAENDNDKEDFVDFAKSFLAKYLINPDGSQFATVDQLDTIAVDDLMLIFNEIADSMSSSRRSKGEGGSGNVSKTTVN